MPNLRSNARMVTSQALGPELSAYAKWVGCKAEKGSQHRWSGAQNTRTLPSIQPAYGSVVPQLVYYPVKIRTIRVLFFFWCSIRKQCLPSLFLYNRSLLLYT